MLVISNILLVVFSVALIYKVRSAPMSMDDAV